MRQADNEKTTTDSYRFDDVGDYEVFDDSKNLVTTESTYDYGLPILSNPTLIPLTETNRDSTENISLRDGTEGVEEGNDDMPFSSTVREAETTTVGEEVVTFNTNIPEEIVTKDTDLSSSATTVNPIITPMQIDLLKAKEASIDITMPTIMNTRATTLAPDEDTTVQLIVSQETTTNIAPIVENIGNRN